MGGKHSRPGSDDSKNGKKKHTDLPDDILKYGIGEYLTPQEQQKLRRVNRFFKQTIDEDRAFNARLACNHILTGQPEELLKLLTKDPELFFHTYPEISFKAAEKVYYKVSPADLVYFLCDADMWTQVKAFAVDLPEAQRTPFFETWQKQQKAMGQGGADLLVVTGNNPPEYRSCFETIDTFNVFGENQSLTRALLKNPDGIVCWKAPDNRVHLYYANPVTKALEPIKLTESLSETQQTAYETFKANMTSMEPNTVRRSSNAEHTLFKAIFRNRQTNDVIKLTREGIHYKQDGIDCMDTHHDFNRLTNVYLKCIHLCQSIAAEQNSERREALYNESDSFWRAELGHIQKEVIWLLQRYCEQNRPFYPLPHFNDSPFQRSLMIVNWTSDKEEVLFDVKTNEFSSGFGVDSNSGFAICKGGRRSCWARPEWLRELGHDLIAENRLNVDATNTVEIPIELLAPVAGLKSGH